MTLALNMPPALKAIVDGFLANARGVAKLIDFDRELLEFAANQIRELQSTVGLAKWPGVIQQIKRTEDILRGVHNNDSLKPQFEIIFNQAVVLLVSYFGSTVEDLFKLGVASALTKGEFPTLLETELKISLGEIRDRGWDMRESAAELLVEKKDLSFQDMQAISRAFRDYLNIEVPRDKVINNIILAQACRHVIVHSGAIANSRLVRQIRDAMPRDLKVDITPGEALYFTPHEIGLVSRSMERYIQSVAGLLEQGVSLES